jgi:hypothetical protein
MFSDQFFVIIDQFQMTGDKNILPIQIDAIHRIDKGNPGPGNVFQRCRDLIMRFPCCCGYCFDTQLFPEFQVHRNFSLKGIKNRCQGVILGTKGNHFPTGSRLGATDFIGQINNFLTIGPVIDIRPG